VRLGRGVEPARGDVGQDGRPAQAKRLSQGDERPSLPRRPTVRSVGLSELMWTDSTGARTGLMWRAERDPERVTLRDSSLWSA
jgi:hypothetical protein